MMQEHAKPKSNHSSLVSVAVNLHHHDEEQGKKLLQNITSNVIKNYTLIVASEHQGITSGIISPHLEFLKTENSWTEGQV